MARLRVEVDGVARSVEGDDVEAWALGAGRTPGEGIEERAAAYVRAHPRPEPDAQGGVNVPARQRMAVLRRLAAGPATRIELLASMRAAAGYVGGDDWRNRLDELRGRGKRGGGHPALPIELDGATATYRLAEPFPALSDADRATLGRLKADVSDRGDHASRALLDAIAPGVDELRDQPSPADGGSSSKASQGSSPRTAASNRR